MAENSSSCIASFYADKSVFITGATGFIGKVLTEKLLRSCPAIQHIYVLLRPKKGQEPKQRLVDLLKDKVFERVEKESPDSLAKLIAIAGDLTLPDLGINTADQLLLTSNVSVVFNSAATVRFDEKLKSAVQMNVLGIRRLLELCHKMEHLEALVHLSTAFSNCDREIVDEIVYDAPVSPQNIIDTIEWMDDELLDEITPRLIDEKPNTYTYTKALAETLLVKERGEIPVAIIRPSIVTAAWKEPFPGWVDNYYGITGLIAVGSKGILRTMHCKTSGTANIIPVDVVSNLVITVGWHIASHRSNKIVVYNCSSGCANNKLTWKTAERIGLPLVRKYPSQEVYFYPYSIFTDSKICNYFSSLLYHSIPAYLGDFCSALIGRKPKLVMMNKKLELAMHHLKYFAVHEWTFNCNNVFELLKTLTPQDKKEFNFDIQNLNWATYMEDYVLGIRQFLFKEDPTSMPAARKNLSRIYLYSKMGQILAFLSMLFILLSKKVPVSVLMKFPWKILAYFLVVYHTLRLTKNTFM